MSETDIELVLAHLKYTEQLVEEVIEISNQKIKLIKLSQPGRSHKPEITQKEQA